MDQQYCLKWNHHQSNLLKVFSRLLGNEQFTDVLLATESKSIRCHKVVLSACSSYFEHLFLTFDEKNQIIILKDTSYDDILALVEFMYRGEINVGQHQLASLLKTAENLKIKGLAEVTSNDSNKDSSSASLIPSTAPTSSSSSSSNAVTNATSTPSSSSASSIPSGSSPKKAKLSLEQATDLSLQSGIGGTPNPSGSSGSNPGGIGNLDPLIMKRKRGRPRILDAPGEPNPFAQTFIPEPKVNPNAALPLPSGLDLVTSTNTKIDHHDDSSNEPTPGGPLTPDRIKELGIIKMNDYLSTGTRQQFWEEYYVKVVMQAVRNKEIDMKTGAEILGVSYGTLYGRYRETFGYLKHAWNAGGRPSRGAAGSSGNGVLGGLFSGPSMVPSSSVLDTGSLHILEQLKFGKINIRQAAELLKVEPTILAYELASKALKPDPDLMDDIHQHELEEEEEDEDYRGQMMEVQPDIVTHDDHDNDEDDDHRDDHGHSEHDHHEHEHDQDDQDARLNMPIPEPQHHARIKEEGVDPIATN